MSTPESPAAGSPPPAAAATPPRRTVWGAARRMFSHLFWGGVMMLAMLVLMFGAASWYTSRPAFCNSCHIMEPYYKSWEESAHRDVTCIECHFEPGIGGKIRGKMLGLVQLAKYLTKSESPRPAADIPDASCLRSGCHETRLLAGKVRFHNMDFDHGPHLGEIRRNMKLRCTSCHSQIVQGSHMSVTLSTCFMCHFKNEPFNEGLGACTHCHQIPEKEYDLGGGLKFTHELAYKKGVDCMNCHGDVIRGQGDVPTERCQVCHNRQVDIDRWKDHELMHRLHTTNHSIDCLSCHLRIEHSLDKKKIVHSAENCQSCHPQHHLEQVHLLRGEGGHAVSGKPEMLALRVGCQTCHRKKDESVTGAVVWKASAEACAACHAPEEVTQLEGYHKSLKAAVAAVSEKIGPLREALKVSQRPAEELKALQSDVNKLEHDLKLLQVGNPIHNIHYASKLARVVSEHTATICKQLEIEPPDLTPLPKWK